MKEVEWTQESLESLAVERADHYGVSRETVKAVIACESSWNIKAVGDGGHSHGLVQVFMPVWKDEVTIEQAQNPYWAIDFLVSKIASGQGNLWTCYQQLKDT